MDNLASTILEAFGKLEADEAQRFVKRENSLCRGTGLEALLMRILLVNTCHFRGGGDSTYTFNLADLLRSKGHAVAFFAMAR